MTKAGKEEQTRAIAQLRTWLRPGDTVYTILRHVSASGMSREIGIVVMLDDPKRGRVDLHPNYLVGQACGYRLGKRDGIIATGCGMDMGFAVVYNLSRTLFPDGFGIEGTGPRGHKFIPTSAEHAAQLVKRGIKFSGRNGDTTGWDNDGGYALRHRWL